MGANDETLPPQESTPTEGLGAGRLFGRYLIIEQVGAGGVGAVYAAYDPVLDRRVALKVLRARSDDATHADSHHHASLVREAKALASLSHPNVVTVHDVGREDDRTFIAMELVEGRDLSQWCKEREARTWRETLKMFIDAGRGLAAAHAKGILHRDFKLANVLVGHDEWVRVSDFGLARNVSPQDTPGLDTLELEAPTMDTSVSVAGRMVGTPYYMAPEQLDGETTVRSDVYAFCLALHDAIYGARAFEAATLMELAVLKAKGAPKPPADPRGVPAPVRAAIERGLAPSPVDRWESMGSLLEVLEHAMRPKARAPWPWVLGLGVVGAVAFGTSTEPDDACTGSEAALEQVWSEARAAALTQGIAASDSPLAQGTADRIRPELDAYGDAWARAHTTVCEATQRGEQSEALLDARMTCLQRQLLEFDAALDVLQAADATVIERAGNVVSALPRPARCVSASTDADEDSPETEAVRAELAQINARMSAGLYKEADERSAALMRSTEDLDASRLRSAVLLTRGNALLKMGQIEPSVDTLEQAAFSAIASGDAEVQLEAAILLITVEGRRAARPKAGLRWARLAEAALAPVGDDPRYRAQIASNLGAVFTELGDHHQAEAQMRAALDLADEAGLSEEERAGLLDNLGTTLRRVGKFEEALATHEDALALREAALGPDHPMVARTLTNTAAAYIELAKFDEADARYERALDIRVRTLGEDHVDVALTLQNLGVAYYRRGRIDDALPYFERALAIRQKALPENHPRVLGNMSNLAQVRYEQGDIDGASELFEDVLRRIERDADHDPTLKSTVLTNLANVRLAQKRHDEAIKIFEKSLALDEAAVGPDHPDVAMTLTNLGNVLEDVGRLDEALALQQRALRIRETKLGPDHPDLIWTLAGLAGVHQSSGNPALAIPLLERGLKIAGASEFDPVMVAGLKFELAQAIDATGGDRDRALALTREAVVPYRTAKGREEDLASIEAFLSELES
ncbi:MAG: tetratricopeptide repeat protein [Nannocystaceae bacterium]|nr:serine/threonine-protein kinase [bacterium]